MKDEMRSEAKRLPYMIGKLIGGFMAVIGFGGTVMTFTRPADPPRGGLMVYLVIGILGIAIFILSSHLDLKRLNPDATTEVMKKEAFKSSALSWIILLALVMAFIIFIIILT